MEQERTLSTRGHNLLPVHTEIHLSPQTLTVTAEFKVTLNGRSEMTPDHLPQIKPDPAHCEEGSTLTS